MYHRFSSLARWVARMGGVGWGGALLSPKITLNNHFSHNHHRPSLKHIGGENFLFLGNSKFNEIFFHLVLLSFQLLLLRQRRPRINHALPLIALLCYCLRESARVCMCVSVSKRERESTRRRTDKGD